MNWQEFPRFDANTVMDWTRPSGLLGDIANYIYSAAYKPVKEVALAGAVAYFAGLMGRAYNISGTGLNQYVILLADTGIGKEAAAAGITHLNEVLQRRVSDVANCISPDFASPQAINRHMAQRSQCFVWIMGEIGLTLQNLCSRYANANDRGLKRALLKLYNNSGFNDVMQGSAFADSGKDLQPIQRPALSLLGESTPSSFYKALDEDNIEEGFVPRLTIIQYRGERPSSNQNRDTQPSEQLITNLAAATEYAKRKEHYGEIVNVGMDVDAELRSKAYEVHCDSTINRSTDEITRQLYNRAHIQLLKLAALLAVGVNYYEPQITLAEMLWAEKLIFYNIDVVVNRFQEGRFGEPSLQLEQQRLVEQCIRAYLQKRWSPQFQKNYLVSETQKHKCIVHYQYLNANLRTRPPFKNAPNMKQAFDNTLKILIEAGKLQEI